MIKLLKHSLLISVLILGFAFIEGLSSNTLADTTTNNNVVIMASPRLKRPRWTLKYVPRRFWGTWYFYRGHNVFNLVKISRWGYTNMLYSTRHHKYCRYHSYIKPENDNPDAKLPSLRVLRANPNAFSAVNIKYRNRIWLATSGWYGAGGDEYSVSNYGHRRKCLTETTGAGFWSPVNAYNSKYLARSHYRK